MNRYMLFAGANYYPAGGADDFVGDYPTAMAAMEALKDRHEWWNILDTVTRTVYEGTTVEFQGNRIEWARGIDSAQG